MFSAKIIKDSVNVTGQRLTTLQLVYPRIIHGELLTHRVFSRNSSSSRAIPVAKVIAQVRDNPAMPVHWGKNQPGMQAFQEVEDTAEAERLWRKAANDAANVAQEMLGLGLHKQIANRLLEPYQWMHTVLSSTEFDNWFALRDHKDAEPNIRYLAQLMRIALDDSTPTLLHHGDWHLPYIKDDENLTLEVALKASAARCARVSYLTHDGHTPDVAKDIELFNRLVGSTPKHCSPIEHQATPFNGVFGTTGNFTGWTQHRKLWEQAV